MSNESTDSDVRLLRAPSTGGARSFRRLYDRHVKSVYLYTLSIVKSPSDAEDVCQEVWITLWASRTRIVFVGDSVLPWLLVTARHKSLKRSESMRRRNHAPLGDELLPGSRAADPEAQLQLSLLSDHVENLLASMPQIDQDIYELCVERGASYESVARTLGKSHGVVRNRLSRVRKRLRSSLIEMNETR